MKDKMLKELTGKEVTIHLGTVSGISDSVKGKVLAIEDSWIKISSKKKVEFINLETVRRISV